jgi:uncharacterized protein YjbJ (UPF0337 family)
VPLGLGDESSRRSFDTKEPAMNWDVFQGKWDQFAGQLKSKWGKLTDDDWTVVRGKKEALVGKLQERYGYKKDEAEKHVDDFITAV